MCHQVKLHFTENALRLIARKAMSKNTGARGLRSILENLLMDAMYEVWHSLFLHMNLKNTIGRRKDSLI